jgi:hypothetical protein
MPRANHDLRSIRLADNLSHPKVISRIEIVYLNVPLRLLISNLRKQSFDPLSHNRS